MGKGGFLEAQFRLDGVAEGVTKIQQGPSPGFLLVLGDDGRLDLDRADDRPLQCRRITRGSDSPRTGQPVEEVRIADQPVLQDLGPAGAQLERRQGRQDIDVGQDEARLMEGPDQILAARRVDRGLAPDRGIDLGQKGRRHLHEVDAAHVERCRQPRQIADDAAAQGDDHVLAVQPLGQQPVHQPFQFRKRLGRLACRDCRHGRANARRFQRGCQGGTVDGGHGLIADDDCATAGERGDACPRLSQQAAFDDHVIGGEALAPDRNRGHCASPEWRAQKAVRPAMMASTDWACAPTPTSTVTSAVA